MSRSIFGWSYPPGCSGPPEPYNGPCEVCGLDADDLCICPECPVCGCVGDPACYDEPELHVPYMTRHHHGMKFNQMQKMGQCLLKIIEASNMIDNEREAIFYFFEEMALREYEEKNEGKFILED